MFGTSTPRLEYSEYAEGTWGEFASSSGRVAFLLTHARLGLADDTGRACRLTNLLSPVREVLEVKNLNFNQLLQRDLDDHRVATELLPYILKRSPTGPAFLPPILAAILPFNGNVAIDHFPSLTDLPNEVIPEFPSQPFRESRYGASFRFQKMVGPDSGNHAVRFGRLSWNNPKAKLVVLDGQHRAMALLAIQRTIADSWKGSSGEQYRFFYEHAVKALLAQSALSDADLLKQLSAVEYPVALCWFPDMHGTGQLPHVAARKLFVDVNKNAREPSASRLVLLSDTELVNIFTRSLLNRLREPNPPLPLFVVEYDNPDSKSFRPVRWTVLTNLLILKDLVEATVFGPARYIDDVGITFGPGRPKADEMSDYFRAQMRFEDVIGLPDEIDEGETSPKIRRDALRNDVFPHYNKVARELIIQRFMDVWGEALLHVLGKFKPWKTHVQAVEDLFNGWDTIKKTEAALAKDALFEGGGMYWTLRDAHNHWQKEVAEGRASAATPPEIAKAWTLIDRSSTSKVRDFSVSRAALYIGKSDAKTVERCDDLFASLNTFACQLGAAMTVATVQCKHPAKTPLFVAELLVKSWNAALEGFSDKRRLLMLGRAGDGIGMPLNMLGRMDSGYAVYYRYFFLELLACDEAHEIWRDSLSEAAITALVETSRELYRDHLINEKAKALKSMNPTSTQAEREMNARAGVDRDLALALKHWCKMKKEEYEGWRVRSQARKTKSTPPVSADAVTDTESADPSAADASPFEEEDDGE